MKRRKVPGSISIPAGLSPELRAVMSQIKETLDVTVGHRGDPLDRSPTVRELVDIGLLKKKLGGAKYGNDSYGSGDVDLSAEQPTVPTNVNVTSSVRFVYVSWDDDPAAIYTEIYVTRDANPTPTSSSFATLHGSGSFTVYSIFGEPEEYVRVFVRHVGIGGRKTAWHSATGTEVQLNVDAESVYDSLMEELAGLSLLSTAVDAIKTATDANGNTVLVLGADRIVLTGTQDDAVGAAPFVVDNTTGKIVMDGALIKNASISAASIAGLTADNIVAGTIKGLTLEANDIVGGTLDIGSGKATIDDQGVARFEDVYARGDVEATSINGTIVTANNIVSNAVTVDKIAANAVTADKISANVITATKVQSGSLSQFERATGSQTATITFSTSQADANSGIMVQAAIKALWEAGTSYARIEYRRYNGTWSGWTTITTRDDKPYVSGKGFLWISLSGSINLAAGYSQYQVRVYGYSPTSSSYWQDAEISGILGIR